MRRRVYRSPAWVLFALVLLSLGACSSYVTQSQQLRPLVEAQKYDEALALLSKLRGGSRLLYLYESGLLLHDRGQWAASDSTFDAAEQLLDDLYTRSLSREVGALIVNDAVIEYRGDEFETALLHYYRIHNFLARGDLEGAAVQVRRLGHQLQLWRDAGKPFAGEGFFAYLCGLVYREAGERVDADVAFRNALAAYNAEKQASAGDLPGSLLCDLAENSAALGDAAAAAQYRADGGCAPRRKGTGRVVLLLECGYTPYKDTAEAVLPILKSDLNDDVVATALAQTLVDRYGVVHTDAKVEYVLRLSIPRLVVPLATVASARMVAVAVSDSAASSAAAATWTPRVVHADAPGRGGVTAVRGLDVAALSQSAFASHEKAVLLRAAVRGVTKYLAKRKADKQGGKGAGWAVNALGLMTETADTRCWSLLPETILWAESDLAPGSYRLVVDTLDRAGGTDATIHTPAITVRAGRTTFVRHRLY